MFNQAISYMYVRYGQDQVDETKSRNLMQQVMDIDGRAR